MAGFWKFGWPPSRRTGCFENRAFVSAGIGAVEEEIADGVGAIRPDTPPCPQQSSKGDGHRERHFREAYRRARARSLNGNPPSVDFE